MTFVWVLAGAAVAGIVLDKLVSWALRRAVSSARVKPGPTPAETQIHAKAQAEREAVPKPDPAAVHALSDKELENAANDRSPLVPPHK